MIKELACVAITCDNCHDDCWEEGAPHFESVDKATSSEWLSGWLITDTEQLCSGCHAEQVCAAEGHDWDQWRPSPTDDLKVFRICDRCSAFDYTVAAEAGEPS